MTLWEKVTSLALVFSLAGTMLPTQALAAKDGIVGGNVYLAADTTDTGEGIDSGTCGVLTWTLTDADGDGTKETLTISGEGAIPDYTNHATPWQASLSSITKVVIGTGVTAIGKSAFEDSALREINLPSSVTSIGAYAFQDCAALTEINIPSNVTSIGGFAFSNCSALTSISLPGSVTTWEYYAFSGCTSLTNATISEGVTSIVDYAFSGCTSLTSVTLPESLTSIGGSAFGDCSALTAINIPFNVSHIGDQAFSGCTSLTGVTLPESLTRIEVFSFQNCSALTEINIPDSVTSIGESAFSGCAGLKSVSSMGGVATIGDSAFTGCASLSDVYYTKTSADWEKISIGTGNDPLANAAKHCDSFVVTFNLSGSSGDAPETQVIAGNAVVTEPATPTREGYTFGGWYQDAACSDKWSFDTPVTENVTLYAKWTANASSSNGGQQSSSQTETTLEDVQIRPAAPTDAIEAEQPLIESSLQQTIVRTAASEDAYVNWIDRLDLPDYATTFYEIMSAGADSSNDMSDCFTEDSYNVVDPDALKGSPAVSNVASMETVSFSVSDNYADGSDGSEDILDSMVFTDDSFNTVTVSESDKAVNYQALEIGDVIKTATYNGVLITKLTKTADFEQQKKDAITYIGTVFQAFDRDHPEVFWLSGKCRVAFPSVKTDNGEEVYFFLTLADSKGFSMRAPAWTEPGAVEQGIARRDAAINTILSTVTSSNPNEQVAELNRWLSEHNEYNLTDDLTTIGNEPHECLSALEGRTGTNGPVCDGYSRAFKVLCDTLGIPCILENGYARTSTQSAGVLHMWNAVQVEDSWYGVDVTWDDPIVVGKSAAKSGYENENYMLVGSSTEISGLAFSYSHPTTNQAAKGGIAFNNGPIINPQAYTESTTTLSSFADVTENDWFHDAVQYVVANNLMNGIGSNQFSPNSSTTRGMIVTILYRMEGEPATTASSFTDVPADLYYANAVAWAASNGIVSGYGNGQFGPNDNITRQQMAAILYRYAQYKNYDVSKTADLSSFTDRGQISTYADAAMQWANAENLITGTSETSISPQGNATRAQIATILTRFRNSIH